MKTSFCSRCSILALSLFVVIATAADNLIVPGVRCGAFILGKTTEKELSAIPRTKALDFQFSRDGILDSVVVASSEYPTDRNVRVGATEEE